MKRLQSYNYVFLYVDNVATYNSVQLIEMSSISAKHLTDNVSVMLLFFCEKFGNQTDIHNENISNLFNPREWPARLYTICSSMVPVWTCWIDQVDADCVGHGSVGDKWGCLDQSRCDVFDRSQGNKHFPTLYQINGLLGMKGGFTNILPNSNCCKV